MESKEQNKKQNRNRLIDTENKPVIARDRREVGVLGEKGEGIKKYKLVVRKQSQGYKVQNREYCQYSNNYA